MCEIYLKLIKLMILLLSHGVKPYAKPPPNFLFHKGLQTFVKIKKRRRSQSWCRMGVNSLFTFGGNSFKTSCMYFYSVLLLINISRLSDSHFDENFSSLGRNMTPPCTLILVYLLLTLGRCLTLFFYMCFWKCFKNFNQAGICICK